jgi:hypothetical protein
MENAYTVFIRKHEGKKHVGELECRLADNIETKFEK